MNTTFRQGIYDWNGTEAEDKLLFQLRQLFAYLQYSASRYHDPVSFLQSTEMSSALQQDVQEFFKMIVTYIVEHAKVEVRKLVETQFMGQIAYNTECKKCRNKSIRTSEFFELELNVKGFKTIEDSLKAYVQEEEMTGANQYFCSKCNALQDGGRYISIRELPRVLSVQMLRFVYDMQTFTKKKVRDTISFPMVLDMRPFVEPKPKIPASLDSDNNESANKNTDKTADNNDNNTTTTTTADNNNNDDNMETNTDTTATETKIEQQNENKNENPPEPDQLPADSQPPPVPMDIEPTVRVTRSQTKQQNPPPPPPSSSSSSSTPSSSQNSDEYIYELTSVMMHRGNTAYGGHYVVHVKDECTGKWWQFNDEDVKPIEEAKVGVIDDTAYDSSSEKPPAEKAAAEISATPVDVDAIASESSATPPSPSKRKPKAKAPKGKGKGKGKKGKEKDDEDSGEGEKGKDSQDKGRISSTMAYMLTYARRGRPILATSAPDSSTMESICKEMDTLKVSASEYNRTLQQETDRLTARKLEFENIQPQLNPAAGAPFNWISTEWLSSWLKATPDLTQIDNTKIICEHNRVDPSKITDMKRISRAVWEHLNTQQYAGGPELTENEYCIDCIYRMCKDEKESTTNTKEKRILLQEVAESDDQEGFWISKDWFKEFSKNTPEDLGSDMTVELVCPHGSLTTSSKQCKLIPKKVWEYLAVLYPDSRAFPSEQLPCQECAQQDTETRELDDRRKKERQNELKALKEFHAKVKTRVAEPLTSEPQYLISYPWCSKWKEWIDDPDLDDPPGEIDNSNLLCPHEKLLYDPVILAEELLPNDTAKMSIKPDAGVTANGIPAGSTNGIATSHANGEKLVTDLSEPASSALSPVLPTATSSGPVRDLEPPPFLLIKKRLWEQVHAKYRGGPEISCTTKGCSPEVCVDCLTSRKLQEEEDRINYTEGSLFIQQAPNGDGKEAPSLPKRASSRYRLREKNPKRKLHPVNSTTDTIQSLKLRIYQLLEVPPFQQALWFNETLLDNESSPLSSYRIPNGSDITLVVIEGNPDLLEEENANKGQCEEGFKGSIFYSKKTEQQETTTDTTNGTKDTTKQEPDEKTNGIDKTTETDNKKQEDKDPPSPSSPPSSDVPMQDVYVSIPLVASIKDIKKSV
eukprot:Phypoly_transcript_00822.p1 GENE.Phypoly_transcript_00822~~Phypoly_transcript_00822.p1  ORF type:complete len:1300 (+),score=300.82 Phypoly_transcript_00822:456-3902(+)